MSVRTCPTCGSREIEISLYGLNYPYIDLWKCNEINTDLGCSDWFTKYENSDYSFLQYLTPELLCQIKETKK